MDILSLGAGMQSSALALMSCENKSAEKKGQPMKFPLVPIYDAVIFCDLQNEPPWVLQQVKFLYQACKEVGISFYILETHLYNDFVHNFGVRRVVAIPFWSVDENGKKAKMRRHCTLDYKIMAIQKFVRTSLLGYKKFERNRVEDIQKHTMHIGFSVEEQQRVFDSKHPFFINKFPLVEMGLSRSDNYAYILNQWHMEMKASACCICPFHRNYFFKYLKENHKKSYDAVCYVDYLLKEKQKLTPIKSSLFISRSRKRIVDLTDEDCNDGEFFLYKGKSIWNGF